MKATAGSIVIVLCLISACLAQSLRTQDFTADPQWEGYRNRLTPPSPKVTRQDFGWRDSNHAKGANNGEIGGWIERSITPAYFATPIEPKTLNDKLTASGKFAVTRDNGNSGMMFGFFHETSRGWRTPNSMVFRIDGNGGKYWVFFEYGTQHWLAGGKGCFIGEQYQKTPSKPFKADGTPHEWSFTYDPDGADGLGLMTFILDGTEYSQPLAKGHKKDGAQFNRFGMFNAQVAGSGMEVYFDDVTVDGRHFEFTTDPGWEALGNRGEFKDEMVRPFHSFGFSQSTVAGGTRGELGGIIWRNEEPAFYGDRIGPLSLDDELHASGTMAFTGAGSDSGVFIGFFNSASKKNKATPMHEEPEKNVLAILLEGPSRIGHYFRPAYFSRSGKGRITESGPIVRPDGQIHRWHFDYDPQGADGNGRITVRFDDAVQTYDLSPGVRSDGATFDRFGLFNVQSGGHYVKVWFDDLKYTAK